MVEYPYQHYNDFELLDLISQGSEEALQIMLEKYEPLIISRAVKFCVRDSSRDDYIQEGRLMLLKAIRKFRPDGDKTFTKYFELVLEHRIISLNRQYLNYMNRTVLVDEIPESHLDYESSAEAVLLRNIHEFNTGSLSEFELEIFNRKFLVGQDVKSISQETGSTEKQIYNTVQRIKKKLLSQISND